MTTAWRWLTVVVLAAALTGCSQKELDTCRTENQRLLEEKEQVKGKILNLASRVVELEAKANALEYALESTMFRSGETRVVRVFHGPNAREECEQSLIDNAEAARELKAGGRWTPPVCRRKW